MPTAVRPLSAELQKKAKEELNEIESRLPEDLNHIREWLKKQHHLKIRSDDQWLITFLRGCKYSLEKTKTKLDLFYSIRSIVPEYYKNRYPFSPVMSQLLNTCSFMILSQTAPEPTRCLLRFDGTTIDDCTFTDIMKFWFMAYEIIVIEDDNALVSGVEVICDHSLINLGIVMQCTPPVLKKVILGFENTLPLRFKAIYGINAPSIIENAIVVAKKFMSEKLRSRMHIYSTENNEKLFKFIPKDIMPKEYGGKNDSVYKLAGDFNKKLESYGPWFLDDEKYGSDETLRPKNSNSPSHYLGMDGSFRKLNVD